MHLPALGVRLSERRTELGLTQQYVADLAGITSRLLSEWEAGRSNPGFKQLNKVLTVLGLQMIITENKPNEAPTR